MSPSEIDVDQPRPASPPPAPRATAPDGPRAAGSDNRPRTGREGSRVDRTLRASGEKAAGADRRPGSVFVGERFPSFHVATPRVHLRPLVKADADVVTEIFRDRLTRRWLPAGADDGPIDGHAWCGEMAEERRAMGQGDHYGIIRREDDELVGCLWAKRTDWLARSTEVSFALAAEARGYGMAAEAIDGFAIELIMRHDFGRIEMRVAPGNIASRRVAEKAGFHYEGLLRNAGFVAGGRVDLEMWSLVAADLR